MSHLKILLNSGQVLSYFILILFFFEFVCFFLLSDKLKKKNFLFNLFNYCFLIQRVHLIYFLFFLNQRGLSIDNQIFLNQRTQWRNLNDFVFFFSPTFSIVDFLIFIEFLRNFSSEFHAISIIIIIEFIIHQKFIGLT
jgi:hypothetical protein